MKSIEVTVAKENRETFYDRFAEINSKFQKKGFPVLVATQHEFVPKDEDDTRIPEYMNEHFEFYTISSSWEGTNLSDIPCDFQGTVNFVELREDSSRIVTCENEEVAQILRTTEMVCDCCKRDVVRGKYLCFLKKDKPVCRDNLIILGRNCAKNYFPFNVDIYLSGLDTVYDELLGEYEDGECFRRHRESHIDIYWLAHCVGKVTNNYTVYNKECGTRNDVQNYIDDISIDFGRTKFRSLYNEIEVMDFEEMKNMLITVYQNPIPSEFNNNIHSVLFDENNNLRFEINKKYLGIAIYAFIGARKSMEKIKAKELERQSQKSSEYVGKIGDKFQMEFIYIKSIWFESQFGYTGFHFFKDDNGNMFKWSSSKDIGVTDENGQWKQFNQGDKVTLKGTIKDHSEYKEVKQTVITRCKIVA